MTAPISVLNEGHRAQQAANAAAVQKLVMQLFIQLIDPKNIVGTAPAWLTQSIAAILRGRSSAIMLATAYATAIRRIQAPNADPFRIPPPDPVPMEKLIRSLTFTGPGKLAVDLAKTPVPLEPSPSAPHFDWVQFDRDVADYEKLLKELPAKAAVLASSAAFQHVADGGRDLIDNVVRHDPVATGYIRVTKTQPCAFCLMLASRGPVYSKESFKESDPRFTGPGNQKVHNGCGCMLQPLYGSKSTKHWTDQARQAEQLWISDAAKYSGREAINAFARAARAQGLADLNRW